MNLLKTTFLLTLLTLLLVAMGGAIGGKSGMMIAFLIAGGMNFFAYWNSDKIVLKMYKAREVTRADSPDFYGIVENLARKANLPMPKVYVIPSDSPNAFATGRNPQNAAVAATTGIMRILSREELEGVMAHELTHVMNRDTLIATIAATIAGAISMLGSMLQWAAIFGMGRGDDKEGGGSVLGSLAMAIIAPIAAMLIQMAVSRSREFMADEGGAKMCGNPKALARALVKLQQSASGAPMQEATQATSHMFIVNPLTASKMASLFSTHPATEDRVARLMAM
ncbi:Heat shock protein. Metallo peptidase. MEROPS family M48B [Desulfomicrobium apsheronum]|uniref:Protease HtpX homolog n=1 Tax=Desulfomicrobium apsheronum TaxID=52560 RepID=A0A1I3SCA7_9BACT|nr:zinc metalloprotease HtpX [Desulfomicrobium apsheronum]SFJ55167.1 Heat shock protein. Metallo peptidase. MEROPS family M48B [Desulfomicrobium apsheronum]